MNPLLVLLGEVTVAFAVALLGARLASRARAAVRHLILASAFGVALVLPVATLVSPPITVEISALPARAAGPAAFEPAMTGTIVGAQVALPVEAEPAVFEAIPMVTMVDEPAVKPPRTMSGTSWLFLIWGAIAAITIMPVGAGLWRLRTIRREGLPWSEGATRLAQLAPAMHTRRLIVLLHDEIGAPITYGLLSPAITLPAGAASWSEVHLANALLHELEHVRRHDWAVHLVSRLVCALYWFNPLVWIAWRALRLEAERACDDAVLVREDAATYAEQLLVLARRLTHRPALPGLQMASNSDLASRIKSVLDSARPRGGAGGTAMTGAVVAAATIIVLLAPLRAVGPVHAGEVPAMIPLTAAAPTRTVGPRDLPLPAGTTDQSFPPEAPLRYPDASPRTLIASILDLVQFALADESTRALDEVMRPITGLHHVQRHAQAVLADNGSDAAALSANYLEIINALANTADLAMNVASRPPVSGLSPQRLRQLAGAMREKSAELAALVMPVFPIRSSDSSTPERNAARVALDVVQTTRDDTQFMDQTRHSWLNTELVTLERAARSFASDDGWRPDATTLKLNLLSRSLQTTVRQATEIANRNSETADARRKAAGLAASLRNIGDRLDGTYTAQGGQQISFRVPGAEIEQARISGDNQYDRNVTWDSSRFGALCDASRCDEVRARNWWFKGKVTVEYKLRGDRATYSCHFYVNERQTGDRWVNLLAPERGVSPYGAPDNFSGSLGRCQAAPAESEWPQ